jgi:hypothetical protein
MSGVSGAPCLSRGVSLIYFHMMPAYFHSRRVRIAGIVAILAVGVVTSFAFRFTRSTARPPVPTLPQAYEQAILALAVETNSFYCLSASAMVISDSSGPTEWHLVFYATNGQLREVVVPTSGKVIVRNNLRERY